MISGGRGGRGVEGEWKGRGRGEEERRVNEEES